MKIKMIAWTVSCLLMSCAAYAAPVDYQYAPGPPATVAREQWQQLTIGVELARDKKVFFSPAPNYPLTTDENDPYDLTDNTLSSRKDDRVWFNKDAVGWSRGMGSSSGILMMIDLGSVQPVGQITIRVLGGEEQDSLVLPKSTEFLASVDGRQYYSLQNMAKPYASDKEHSNGKTGVYFPEDGKAFMAPLVCRVPVMARYLAIRVMPIFSFFTDQISVLKATSNMLLKNLESFPKAQVYTDGLAVSPRHKPFVVTTNIDTPNWVTFLDNTGLDLSKHSAAFRIELPDGLKVLPISKPGFKEVASTTPGMHSYVFRYDGKTTGPLWIQKDPAVAIPTDAKVLFTGIVDGKDSHMVQAPLKLVAIPETHPVKGLDVSLAWMNDSVEQQWPNFLRDFRKMGFNYVSTFPQYFQKNKDGSWNADAQESLDFLKLARAQGYDIVLVVSPFISMWKTIQKDLKAGRIDDVEAAQLFTQVNGKRGERMNILYRGKYYQNEIKRVAHLAALVQPDHVYLDIEWWDKSVAESKNDPRVVAAWKVSGKEKTDFVTDIGTEVMGKLVSEMRKAVPNRKLLVGQYNSDPTKLSNSFFDFHKLYPEILNIAQPQLYKNGRPLLIASRIRLAYSYMQTKQTIPWMTTGTYGEFDPSLVEPIVLEAILNGSRGIAYFQFSDFDPMDFYYHSKAIKELAPYETLLQNGKPIAYKGDNPGLDYTAFASTNEALVLIGNYKGSASGKVTLPLPMMSAKKVLLDGKPLPIENNSVSLDVPAGEFRLIYFSG